MEKQVFKLEFTKEELSILEAGLKELPGKFCLPLLDVMNKQLLKQVKTEKEKEDK